MPQIKLSDRNIDAIKAPHRDGRQTLYWDRDLKGFGVQVSGISNVKSYVAAGRVNGKPVRKTLGRVGVLEFAEARQLAREMISTFGRGVDPSRRHTSTMTLKQATDAYVNAHPLKPRTKEGYVDVIERYLPDWADMPLGDITLAMAEEKHQSIAAEIEKKHSAQADKDYRAHLVKAERAEVRWPQAAALHRARAEAAKDRKAHSGKATANNVLRVLRAVYNYAARRAAHTATPMPPNPVMLHRQWHRVSPRERIVTNEQLPGFYQAIMNLESPVGRDYLLLVLFTGLRRREAAGLRWSEVDLTAKTLSIPAERNKSGRRFDLTLSDFVHDLLVARSKIGKTEFVFMADSRSGHIATPRYHLELVEAACGVFVSIHDLRRTFLTIAESCEISPMALKALANHSQGGDITARYVQMNVDRLRKPAQTVTNRIKELCQSPLRKA